MGVSPAILDTIRHCQHSRIMCDNPALQPDYHCDLDSKLCVLYARVHCTKIQPFDEEKVRRNRKKQV